MPSIVPRSRASYSSAEDMETGAAPIDFTISPSTWPAVRIRSPRRSSGAVIGRSTVKIHCSVHGIAPMLDMPCGSSVSLMRAMSGESGASARRICSNPSLMKGSSAAPRIGKLAET